MTRLRVFLDDYEVAEADLEDGAKVSEALITLGKDLRRRLGSPPVVYPKPMSKGKWVAAYNPDFIGSYNKG